MKFEFNSDSLSIQPESKLEAHWLETVLGVQAEGAAVMGLRVDRRLGFGNAVLDFSIELMRYKRATPEANKQPSLDGTQP